MSEIWPWAALAGLGAFHGINPAMGWLFAVALGLHRGSRAVLFGALLAIALGHALAIALAAGGLAAAGLALDRHWIWSAAGLALIGWALCHWRYGGRHHVRVGMRTGYAGLVLWSALMATAHGAGLMLIPALMPLGIGTGPEIPGAHAHHVAGIGAAGIGAAGIGAAGIGAAGIGAAEIETGGIGASLATALAAVGVHSLAMLAAAGLVAAVIYEWAGLAVLRRGWINLDRLWSLALLATGVFLLAS